MAWPTLAELVSNFAPILHLDKDEVNLPSSTDWYIGQVGYQAAGGIYSGPGQWNWGTAEQSSPDDYLVAPQAIWASLMKGYIPTATSYVHVLPVDDRTDMVDLQYWLFYPYNGQETFEVTGWTGSTGQALMPLSIHWGDWECVTVRVNIDQQVVGVFFSQHSGGQWCSPNDGFLSLSGTHPNVYVASGSHANYPAASNSTYEIGGVDVWDVRFAVADYARGGGPTVNLSAPNPPVVIQNDAQAILPTPVTSPPWLAFRGRWGQPIEPTLTDAGIGSLVAAAASGMQLNVLVEDAVQYVAGSTTLQAWLSEVILPIAKGDLTGPTGPSQKGSWAVTPTFLPFGTDAPIASSVSLVPVALATMPGSQILCIGMGSPLPPAMRAWSLNQGKWSSAKSPTMSPFGGLAACATPSGGLALLGLGKTSLLAFISSSGASGGPWSAAGLWPAPPATTGASIGQLNGVWYIAWGGADGSIQYLSTTDWVHFGSPQSVMIPSVDGPVPATIAGGGLVAPAVESCGGALVIVAPIAGLEKGMPMVLGAYVSSDGSNWTGPNLLPSMSLCSNTSGALAAGPNGTLYCFYADNNKKVRYSVTSDGADWSDSGTIAGAFTSRTPSVVPWQGGFLVVHPGKSSPTVYWNSATFE